MKREQVLKFLKSAADLRGLHLLGISDLGMELDYQRYLEWLGDGNHAGMTYMENNQDVRKDPSMLLEGARSAIVVGLDYSQGDKLSDTKTGPLVAQYGRLKDYHKILWKEGEALLDVLHTNVEGSHKGRVLVDTAPLFERSMAARTERGFIGKNTLYIHPEHGSFFLLAVLLTTYNIEPDKKIQVDPGERAADGGCGTCKRCQTYCPTGALSKDYLLDANLCLSYWTIEHRGPIPEKFWPHLGTYFFGCDLCQLSCPYNRGKEPNDQLVGLRKVDAKPNLSKVAVMDQKYYESTFGGTPLTRAKRSGLMRNALIALYVTNDPALSLVLKKLNSMEVPEDLEPTISSVREKVGV